MSSQIYDEKIPQGWEVVRLGDICDVRDGTHDSPKYTDFGIPLITSKNIVNGNLDLTDISYITQSDADKINERSKVDINDILMSMIGTIGNAILVNKIPNFCIKNVALFKPNHSKISAVFLVQLIQSKIFKNILNISLDGGIQKFISLWNLRNLEILIPKDKVEQEKIAQVLGDMDDLISAKCELLDKKRDIKQGAAQQLLTPKPHWHTATLGVCVEIITPPSKINTIEYSKSGKFPIIDQSQDFICGWTDDDKKVIKISEPVIIFGDHTCVTKFVNFDFAQGADGIKILKSKKFLNPKFLYQLLQFDPIVPEMYKRHFSKLKGKKILYPKDKAEQKMIAQVLGDMDDEISALQDEIEKLKMIKQGAMDELLSGKIRLKR